MNKEGTVKEACTPPILVRVNLEGGVMFLMRKIPRPCSGRLIICEEDYVVIDGEGLLPILIPLLAMIEMLAIDTDEELPLVNLSRMRRTTTMSVGVSARHAKA